MQNNSIKPFKKCKFDGCKGRVVGRGYCPGHYDQLKNGKPLIKLYQKHRKSGTPPRIICDEVYCPNHDLFGPCHVYRGGKDSNGYGLVRADNKNTRAHQYVWVKEIGPIPEGLVIDHQCRNRGCCNTDHLRAVTHQVNMTENIVGASWQLGKAKTHCLRGHCYNEENTIISKMGTRQCRACHREETRRRRQKKKTMQG